MALDKAAMQQRKLIRRHPATSCAIGLFLVGISLGTFSCVSPESEEKKQDAFAIAQVTDSLSAEGQHGYYVAQYLIGRFKTSRIEKTTFEVSVKSIDKRLLDYPMLFRVLDTLAYQLSYSLDEKETVLVGEFDQVLEADVLRIQVDRPAELDSEEFRRVVANSLSTDYEFRTYEY